MLLGQSTKSANLSIFEHDVLPCLDMDVSRERGAFVFFSFFFSFRLWLNRNIIKPGISNRLFPRESLYLDGDGTRAIHLLGKVINTSLRARTRIRHICFVSPPSPPSSSFNFHSYVIFSKSSRESIERRRGGGGGDDPSCYRDFSFFFFSFLIKSRAPLHFESVTLFFYPAFNRES